MADDDIEDIDFDDDDVDHDDVEYDEPPPPRSSARNARRELEKHLEMKRLRELLGSEFEDDF